MKKLLPFLSISILALACNQTPQAIPTSSAVQTAVMNAPDTAGLASYQQWKAQNELTTAKAYQSAQATAPAVVTKIIRVEQPKVHRTPAPKPQPASQNTTSSSSQDAAGSQAGSQNSESTGEAKAVKKQGVSKAVKGAVIGGVAGAAGGAILNKKNRVLGAVIGGVIGAAGGYGIGHGMDKKDGRIDLLLGL